MWGVTKPDFIDQLAKKTGMSKKGAKQTLDTALDLITSEVKKNGKVQLTGFGTFEAGEMSGARD